MFGVKVAGFTQTDQLAAEFFPKKIGFYDDLRSIKSSRVSTSSIVTQNAVQSSDSFLLSHLIVIHHYRKLKHHHAEYNFPVLTLIQNPTTSHSLSNTNLFLVEFFLLNFSVTEIKNFYASPSASN